MTSTLTPVPAPLPTVLGTAAVPAAAVPAAAAATTGAAHAPTRLRAQDTSALRRLLGAVVDVPGTGLPIAGLRALAVVGTPVQGPPPRGTPV